MSRLSSNFWAVIQRNGLRLFQAHKGSKRRKKFKKGWRRHRKKHDHQSPKPPKRNSTEQKVILRKALKADPVGSGSI